MTLNTSVRILAPVSLEALWKKCREITGIPSDDTRWVDGPSSYSPRWHRHMQGGLGYNAWLWINYKPDAFFDPAEELKTYTDPEDIEWFLTTPQQPYFYEVSWDTSYGYSGGGETCSSLHWRYTNELGKWLDDQGVDWIAQNEFTGEWDKCPMPN